MYTWTRRYLARPAPCQALCGDRVPDGCAAGDVAHRIAWQYAAHQRGDGACRRIQPGRLLDRRRSRVGRPGQTCVPAGGLPRP
jgi:hypothetical protein